MLTRYRKPRPLSKTYLRVMTVVFILLVFMCSEDYSALAIQGEGITYVNCAMDNGQYVYETKQEIQSNLRANTNGSVGLKFKGLKDRYCF